MAKTIPTDKARQGRWGRHTLLILVIAMILVFIVWGAVEIYGEMIKPPAPAAGAAMAVPAMHAAIG
jgi:hypothetical protein